MCKGTTNGEDIYIIDVSNLSQIKPFNLINQHGGLPVDKCIGKEIEFLLKQGVITYGCCCGHGKNEPQCLVDKSSESILNKLGYELQEYSNLHTSQGIYEIKLKRGNFYGSTILHRD